MDTECVGLHWLWSHWHIICWSGLWSFWHRDAICWYCLRICFANIGYGVINTQNEMFWLLFMELLTHGCSLLMLVMGHWHMDGICSCWLGNHWHLMDGICQHWLWSHWYTEWNLLDTGYGVIGDVAYGGIDTWNFSILVMESLIHRMKFARYWLWSYWWCCLWSHWHMVFFSIGYGVNDTQNEIC